jgi:Aldose 1-epimerase
MRTEHGIRPAQGRLSPTCRDHYTPVTDEHIPTGDLDPVKGTPFDFTKAKKIGTNIAEVSCWPVHAMHDFHLARRTHMQSVLRPALLNVLRFKTLHREHAQVEGGYDHNFALKSSPSKADPKWAALTRQCWSHDPDSAMHSVAGEQCRTIAARAPAYARDYAGAVQAAAGGGADRPGVWALRGGGHDGARAAVL